MANKNVTLQSGGDNLYPQTKIENITDLSSLNVNALSSGAATSGQVPTANGSGSIAWSTLSTTASGVSYLTTAPSAANTDGDLKFVVLSSDPATKYSGYIYIITGA